MPYKPEVRGRSVRVKWRHAVTKETQCVTISEFEKVDDNQDVADALYSWLKFVRYDNALDTEPAIKLRHFLNPAAAALNAAGGEPAPTFGEVAEEVISRKTHVEESTRAKSRAWVRNHFADWESKPINEISEDEVNAKALAIKENYAAWTRHQLLSFLKEVYRRAVKKKYIEADADHAEGIKLGTPQREKEMVMMTAKQFALLERAAVDEQTKDMLRFIVNTGCRISEVHALRVGRCDVGPGVAQPSVFISKAFSYDNTGVRSEGPPKGGKPRRIALDSTTAALVAKYTEGKEYNDFLFPGPRNEGWYYTYWRNSRWEPTVKVAQGEFGLRPEYTPTPHELRHTHASWLLAAGVDIQVLSKRLGHSDPAFTLRTYTHVTERGEDKLMSVLAELAG